MKFLKLLAVAIMLLAVSAQAKTGQELFNKCEGCHGTTAQKKALGKSEIIQGWDVNKTVKVLQGYKTGIYGGPMKGLMKGQVISYSDKDIENVAEYISSLK